jgi:hypothetical protein
MTDDLPELHYEQTPPLHKRKSARRLTLLLAIVAGLIAAIPLLKYTLHHLRLVRLYRSCCDTDPASLGYSSGTTPPTSPATPCWLQLNQQLSTTAGFGTIFLGELQTPDARRTYLVGLNVTGESRGFATLELTTRARTIDRVGMGSPRYGPVSDPTIYLRLSSNGGPFAIHGGIVDSRDRSHFTMKYETPEASGVIDGWLCDDGTVVLEPRKPATTALAPPSPATFRSADQSLGPAAGRVGR